MKNYFKLEKGHQKVTDTIQRIAGLQVIRINDGHIEAECTLCFRWNAAQSRFDLIQHAMRQGKMAATNTVIAHCAIGEEIGYELQSSRQGPTLRGSLLLPSGDRHEFELSYSYGNYTVRLVVLPAESIRRFVPKVVTYQK